MRAIFFACPKKTNQKKGHPNLLALRGTLKNHKDLAADMIRVLLSMSQMNIHVHLAVIFIICSLSK